MSVCCKIDLLLGLCVVDVVFVGVDDCDMIVFVVCYLFEVFVLDFEGYMVEVWVLLWGVV